MPSATRGEPTPTGGMHNACLLLLAALTSPTVCYTPATKAELEAALTAWNTDATAAAAMYGAVGAWDVTAVTSFYRLLIDLDNF